MALEEESQDGEDDNDDDGIVTVCTKIKLKECKKGVRVQNSQKCTRAKKAGENRTKNHQPIKRTQVCFIPENGMKRSGKVNRSFGLSVYSDDDGDGIPEIGAKKIDRAGGCAKFNSKTKMRITNIQRTNKVGPKKLIAAIDLPSAKSKDLDPYYFGDDDDTCADFLPLFLFLLCEYR